MTTVSANDLARYRIRPLLPGPMDVVRDISLQIGAGTLPILNEAVTREAFVVEGLSADQTRVLERELSALGGTTLSTPDGQRALLIASLIAMSMLAEKLIEWGQSTQNLGRSIRSALLGKGAVAPPVSAGRYTLTFGTRTLIMGVLNVTPDSFSGDGVVDAADAIERGRRLIAEGADILDVGAESSRPGATAVSPDEECARLLPVVNALADSPVPISVDTRHASTAQAALRAGASIINDISGLRGEEIAAFAHQHDAAVVAMHNCDHIDDADPLDVICSDLRQSLVAAEAGGLESSRVIVDPGFGFGKTPAQNLDIIRRLSELRGLGRPILVGPSRKSTIGTVLDGAPAKDRLEGTIALCVLAAQAGADIVRVHDVAQCRRALRVSDAVTRELPPPIATAPIPAPTL